MRVFVCLCPDFIYPLYRLSRAVFPHKGGTGGTQLGKKMCAIKIFKSFTDRKATSCAVLLAAVRALLTQTTIASPLHLGPVMSNCWPAD